MRSIDFCGRESHHHLLWVLGSLLIYGVDESQRAMRVLAFELLGLHPNRKEFSSKISCFCFGEIEIALISGRRIRHIEVLVEQALRRVCVSIDYQ